MEAGELYLGEGKPFPSTAWGCRPKTLRSAVRCAHCLTTEFSCGKLAQFWRSKVLSRLTWCAFNFQKCFRYFPDAFSAFGRTPRASRGSFSCFGSAPGDFPAHFQPLGAFPRLPRRISGLRERSHGFHGAFPGFGSIPKVSQAQFCLSGVCPNALTGIVRAWRGNHTKSFHQEDEPWQRRQLQR